MNKSVHISGSAKRQPYLIRESKAGPADYCYHQKRTKILPKIQERRPRATTPMLSGELSPESWIKPIPPPPKRRFPQTKFESARNSPAFASRVQRDLFSIHNDDGNDLHSKRKQMKSGIHSSDYYSTYFFSRPNSCLGESSAFRSIMPRFPELETSNLSPCSYNPQLPSQHIPSPTMKRSIILDYSQYDPQEKPSPGPGYYNPEGSAQKHVFSASPVFANRIERKTLDDMVSQESRNTPSPDSYQRRKRDIGGSKHSIQTRDKWTTDTWIPKQESPGIGYYNPNFPENEGITFSKAKRKPINDVDNDLSNGGFTTQHGDFIKRSYSTNYPSVLLPR